jgi:hypothetical protein
LPLLRVYYAHAMCLYGTAVEKAEMLAIAAHLPDHEIVNPGTLQSADGNKGMQYWFSLVDGCDALVFSRLLNRVTAGVGLEVNHALARPIPVHELLHQDRMIGVVKPVQFLTREETLKHFEFWRTIVDPKLEAVWVNGCLLRIRKA